MYRDKPVQSPAEEAREYGECVLCGDRVYNNHDYITTEEGYCHKSCVSEA